LIQSGYYGTSAVAFSPNGRFIINAHDYGGMCLWEVDTGYLIRSFVTPLVRCVAFSPDGQHVISGHKHLSIWDISTGRCMQNFPHFGGDISSVSFSPDGKHVLSGDSDGLIRLWDTNSGNFIRTFESKQDNYVASLAFSPDGRLVLSSSGPYSDCSLWDMKTGVQITCWKGRCCFNVDGQIMSVGYDDVLRVWDVVSDGCFVFNLNVLPSEICLSRELVLEGLASRIEGIYPNANGNQAVTVSCDGFIQIWDTYTAECLSTSEIEQVYFLGMSPTDRQAITWDYCDAINLWDLESGECLQKFAVGFNCIVNCTSSQNGNNLLICLQEGSFELLDLQCQSVTYFYSRPDCLLSFALNDKGIVALSRSKFSQPYLPGLDLRISFSEDIPFQLCDINSGKCLHILEGHDGDVISITFSPDGKKMLSGGEDCNLRLWDVSTGECLKILEGHSHEVSAVAISPCGTFALSGSCDHTVRLWDLAQGHCIKELLGHTASIISIAFSPDGTLIISGSDDETIRLWNCEGLLLHVLQGHSDYVTSVAFSSDSTKILSASNDSTIRLWEVETGNALQVFKGHFKGILYTSFTKDEQQIVSASRDGTIRYWNVMAGEELVKCYYFDDGNWIVVTPDGRYDSSNDGECSQLRWTVGIESFPAKQFKDRYYTPGLLATARGE